MSWWGEKQLPPHLADTAGAKQWSASAKPRGAAQRQSVWVWRFPWFFCWGNELQIWRGLYFSNANFSNADLPDQKRVNQRWFAGNHMISVCFHRNDSSSFEWQLSGSSVEFKWQEESWHTVIILTISDDDDDDHDDDDDDALLSCYCHCSLNWCGFIIFTGLAVITTLPVHKGAPLSSLKLSEWLFGWWFGTFFSFFMTFHILGMSSSQLTFTPSFFRGVGTPPTRRE